MEMNEFHELTLPHFNIVYRRLEGFYPLKTSKNSLISHITYTTQSQVYLYLYIVNSITQVGEMYINIHIWTMRNFQRKKYDVLFTIE